MKTNDFNTEARTPRFTYRRSPVHPRGFQIMCYKPEAGLSDSAPCGEYTVLDATEDLAYAERKVMNLVSLLNGRKQLMQLGHETGTRVLYQVVTECDDDNMTRILFYNLGREGVSIENALLRMERDEHAYQ